jgi:hypothetical protein
MTTDPQIAPRLIFHGVLTGHRAGHYFNESVGGRIVWAKEQTMPPDVARDGGVFARPVPLTYEEARYTKHEEQPQGRAFMHFVCGWTIVAWWDRSEDTRGGCSAAFFAEGRRPFARMMAMARERFPREMARIDAAYPVVLAGPDVLTDEEVDRAEADAAAFLAERHAAYDALRPAVRELVDRALAGKVRP